jgi:uncharacterized protein with PQ loop repeat
MALMARAILRSNAHAQAASAARACELLGNPHGCLARTHSFNDEGHYCNYNITWKTRSACQLPLAPNRPPKASSPAKTFGKVVAAMGVAAVLMAACAACFGWVLHWSKQPTGDPVLGIVIEDSATRLIKQLVGFVAMRVMWSMFAIAVSTIGLMVSTGSNVAIVDWVVSLPLALCIPACGYCGAKERHRLTLGLFIACNLASAIWSTVALILSELSQSAANDSASPIEDAAATTFAIVLQIVSIALSVVNAVVGYRLWDHSFMRSALEAALVQSQPAAYIVAPAHPVMQSTGLNASVDASAAGVVAVAVADPHSSSVRPRPVHAPTNAVAHSWSVEQVSQWLDSDLSLSELGEAALRQQIDGPTAAEMGPDAWQELGATAIQTARIIGAFKRIGTFAGAE